MLYDLNVPWFANQTPQELQRTVTFLSELGYETIALNHALEGPLPAQIKCAIPETLPFAVPAKTTILRRCTMSISDPSQNYRMSNVAAVYDILALRPTTEKAFAAACGIDLNEHSIISLDLTIRHPFYFKPVQLMTAVRRGVKIEICYAQGTMQSSHARKHFISNVLEIIRATKGRGLMLSSEARSMLGVRSPADVTNLVDVWGLGRERAKEAMGINPRGVVVNESMKRSSFRGVVDVIYGGERPVDDGEAAKRKSEEDVGPKISKRAKLREKKATTGQSSAGAVMASATGELSNTQRKKQRKMEALAAKENDTLKSASTAVENDLPVTDAMDT